MTPETTTVLPAAEPIRAAAPRAIPTVIIGAGQTGLATAYYLRRAGHDCLVLHAENRVGDQWRNRYASLRLNTPAVRDALPGTPFPAPPYSFPTGAEMGDYLERYAAEHGIPVQHRTEVTAVRRGDDGCYQVLTTRGPLVAENVVVATGAERIARIPECAERLDPGIRQIHSGAYRSPDQFLPGPVLVVGASQSGADLALEAAQAGHEVWLAGRVHGEVPVVLGSRKARIGFPVLWFLANHVLTLRTPIGRRIAPKIRAGGTPLLRVKRADLDAAGVRRLEDRVTGAVDGKPELADGTVLDVANVLWCTGYRSDFSFITPSVVGENGWPRERGGVVPESPGLYFMGLLFQRGFYSMLIGGAGRDAKFIARLITVRSRRAARR
jgi:putative flavoprotein involved in K+ transport